MFHRILSVVVLLALAVLLLTPPLFAGGWTVVTLDKLPTNTQAGEPIQLGFLIQQHGVTPLELGDGQVVIRAWQQPGGKQMQVVAAASGEPGYYAAEIVFPTGGVWTWEVRPGGFPPAAMPDLTVATAAVQPPAQVQSPPSEWGWWQQTLFQVISSLRRPVEPVATAAVDLAQDPAAYGKALFVAKGCVTCHVHGEVATEFSVEMGPNLTSYKVIPEYVAVWLRDPKSIKSATQMPQLPMQDREVEALIAFLSAGQK